MLIWLRATLAYKMQQETGASTPKFRGGGTGSITLLLENNGLFLTVSEKKWVITSKIIRDMLAKFNDSDQFTEADLKDTESKLGVLLHRQ